MRAAVHQPRLHAVRWGKAAPAPVTLLLHPSALTAPIHAVLSTSPELSGAVWSVALSEAQQALAHRLPAEVRLLLNQTGLPGVRLLLLDLEPSVQTALASLFSAEVQQFVAFSLPAGWREQAQPAPSFPTRALRKLLRVSLTAPSHAHLLSSSSALAPRGAA
ncbi:hypothetical protein [Deinococcus aquatilis]|uniref:hypothetical protein n=1 Tax=Deinococcus aquatilis TaxID=519440 RepID=UPI0003602D58|nr:hypothetical protein [Deinococcus aquatilis]